MISPDGKWIAFSSSRQLLKIGRDGGSPIKLADSLGAGSAGAAWLDDGTIVYRDVHDRLMRVPDTGGEATAAWAPGTSGMRAFAPTPLPGARGVLVVLCKDAGCSRRPIAMLDFKSGQMHELVPDAAEAWYAPTGHLVFVRRDGGVFGAPFDVKRERLTGPSVPLLDGVQVRAVPAFAVSASGSMLMIAGPADAATGTLVEAVWVTRDGKVTPVDTAWQFRTGGNAGRALSPDGRRLALTIAAEGGNDIWVKDLDHGPLSRLSSDPGPEIRPRWTPDGRSVLYISSSQMLLRRRADGTLPPDTLLRLPEPIFEAQWSRDGAWIVVRVGGQDGTRDIWARQVGKDSTARRVLASPADENAVALSPDSRWIAYQSNETGTPEVFVRPFPDVSAGKWTVSLGGGSEPIWSHSGKELFYIDDHQNMVAARVRSTGSTAFEVTERKVLFSTAPFMLTVNYSSHDVTPDDQRFLMVRRAGVTDSVRTAIVLTENWFEELRARMGK